MGWLEDMKNQSFVGSYANARRLLNSEELAANDDDSGYMMQQALKAQQGQAIAGGIITGLTGATTLLSNAMKDAQIRDTSMQERQIADLRNAGNFNYQNYDQLANDYASTNFNPQINYDDIRGMSEGQQIGSVGTSTLTGAAIGTQILPGWGTAIGAGVGLLTGLGGVLSGNDTAKTRMRSLQLQSGIAAANANQNFMAAHERIGDNIHRQNAVNAVARGGQINRLIDKTLMSYPKQREHRGGNVMRIRKDGGFVYRVKSK